jgi:hypothetical protein
LVPLDQLVHVDILALTVHRVLKDQLVHLVLLDLLAQPDHKVSWENPVLREQKVRLGQLGRLDQRVQSEHLVRLDPWDQLVHLVRLDLLVLPVLEVLMQQPVQPVLKDYKV